MIDDRFCKGGSAVDRGELLERMEDFAVRVSYLVDSLPQTRSGRVFGGQVLRASSSVGANYCESEHASSRRHFITTLEIAQREAKEARYWMRLIAKRQLVQSSRLGPLAAECDELVAILTAAILTAKSRSPS